MSEQKKITKIGAIPAVLIRWALSSLKSQLISKIPNEHSRKIAEIIHKYTGKTLEALSDDDYLNGKQVEQIWLECVIDAELQAELKFMVYQGINKLDNAPHIRTMLNALVDPLFATVSVFADGNQNDAKQIAGVWVNFFKNPKNTTDFFSFVLQFIKDPQIAGEIIAAVADLIGQLLHEVTI